MLSELLNQAKLFSLGLGRSNVRRATFTIIVEEKDEKWRKDGRARRARKGRTDCGRKLVGTSDR